MEKYIKAIKAIWDSTKQKQRFMEWKSRKHDEKMKRVNKWYEENDKAEFEEFLKEEKREGSK